MIDFEAEGLLDDVEGDAGRARCGVLERLAGEGVPLDELREAVEGGRLALLPVERAGAGHGARYTPREVADKVGIYLGILQHAKLAFGGANPDSDDLAVTEADLEA